MPKFKYPDVVQFTAYGIPQTKGSTRSFVKGEKVITTNDNPKTKDWHHIVAWMAQTNRPENGLFNGAVSVRLKFTLYGQPGVTQKKGWRGIRDT